jgi:hypothetical protein
MAKQSIGRDLSVSFSLGGNVIRQFGLTTSVKFSPVWTEVVTRPINNGGIPEARAIFGGHNVEVMFDRVNGVSLALSQFIEDNFVAGNADVNVTLQSTIRNADGSVDQVIYLDGIIYPTNDGDFKGVDTVSQSYKMFFKRTQIVSTAHSVTVGNQRLTA